MDESEPGQSTNSLTEQDTGDLAGPTHPAAIDDGSITGKDLATGGHRPGLDGMRAVAMSVMLAYHAQLAFGQGAFLGLSQFFTLSGFLITGLLLRAHDQGGIRLKSFWASRFRRLMPAALICLAGIAIFGATVATGPQAEELPGQVTAAATYTANWFFIVTDQSYVDLFAAPSPVQHYWSLSVEEQFYLFMPLLVLAMFRWLRSPKHMAAVFAGSAVASTAWMIYLYRNGSGLDRLYYGTDTRAAEVFAGCFLAVAVYYTPRISRTALGVMATMGVVAYAVSVWGWLAIPLADGPIWQGGYLGYAILSCLVILGIISGRGPLPAVLSFGPLPALGRVTYSVYLYHWPIFLWLTPDRTGIDQPWLFPIQVALTLVLATISYNLIEMPIRKGEGWARQGWALTAAAPVAVVLIIGATALLANTAAPDPFEAIRSDDRTTAAPVTPSDGVLDLLVITDEAGATVVDHMEDLAGHDPTVNLVRAESFTCSELTGAAGERVCSNWAEEWKGLIQEHNPDLTLIYLDDWSSEEVARISGPGDDPHDLMVEVLDEGVDLLTASGAPVMWSSAGTSPAGRVAASLIPFRQAMLDVELHRDDFHRVLAERLPDPTDISSEEYVDRSAQVLLSDASLYQRADHDRLTRVMVLGDSQARSLGYGLERWGAEQDLAVVWNAATEGCGLFMDGTVQSFGGESPISERCTDARDLIPEQVESFDPDVVVVLSSIWDIQDRSLPSWDGFQSIGYPPFDERLREAYQGVLDDISATGAAVVWMTAPCNEFGNGPGNTGDLPAGFEDARSAALNDRVLEPMARESDALTELFRLDEVLCPGGRFENSFDGTDQVRVDGIHFSVEGSLWFADRYGEHIVEIGRQL